MSTISFQPAEAREEFRLATEEEQAKGLLTQRFFADCEGSDYQ